MMKGYAAAAAATLLLAACAAPTPREPTKGHLTSVDAVEARPANIPAPVQQTLALPKPRALPKAETYSVVVNNVAVKDLLFALARDAKLNVDIHPGISGTVTLNAIEQTLPQLLNRIAKQVDLRFELDGPNLAVMPDSPFLRHYKVDYVNLARNVTTTVSANTQIATVSTSATGAGSGPAGGNVSATRIENTSRNRFWEQLEKNIKDILHETDKVLPEGSSETVTEQTVSQSATGAAALPQGSGQKATQAVASALATNPSPASASQGSGTTIVRRSTIREAASVIANPETGIVTVRATQRQHDRIQEFIDRVVSSARRQVMIEATIVEVKLADGYEQGIDWTRLIGSGQFSLAMNTLRATNAGNNMTFTGNTVTAGVRLLETFGTTKVLSSPRLSVMNNQTAMLTVVDNVVYFNVKADVTAGNLNANPIIAYTTTPQTVSVGLVMAVTPQIGDNQDVILNIRPTVTSISDFVTDPNPNLTTVSNRVPQIRTREIESIMRVANGEIAVLGGLMDDRIDYKNNRVPLLGQIPVVGEVFTNRNNAATKSELVIFLRPIIIRDASLAGDYSGLRGYLPDGSFFPQPPEARPFAIVPGRQPENP